MSDAQHLRGVLQELILDFQEREFTKTTPRLLQLKALSGKASVCIGVRRCGKSTLLLQRAQALLSEGVTRDRLVYLNLFDDRLHGLTGAQLGLIVEAYYLLYPHKKGGEVVYFFLDELQVVKGWEPFVDRLMRSERAEVYITGSSAHLLSKEIATQMRGRSLSWELFPFSFGEFLDHIDVEHKRPLSTKRRLKVEAAFERYYTEGGFPEVVGLDHRTRARVHQEYLNATLFHDLIERHDISHPRAIVDLAHRLLNNVGSLYTLNKLTSYLRGLGHKVPKTSVADYLKWFEDAFMIFTVFKYDASLSKANVNPKKVYCVDHALVTSVSAGVLRNAGHLLENLVFMCLRRLTSRVSYYKTKTGWEVDFIATLDGGTRVLVQVCETLADESTRRHECRALRAALLELKLTRGLIVTRSESEVIESDGLTIEVIPVWRFALEIESYSG